MPQVMQAYLHFIWWRPQENWGLNRGLDGRHQTDEEFELVRGKHSRVSDWAPDGHVWWCCQIKGRAAMGLMAVVYLFTSLSFLYCYCIRYIISRTVRGGNREWMWPEWNNKDLPPQLSHRVLHSLCFPVQSQWLQLPRSGLWWKQL